MMNGPDVETVRSICQRYREAEITAGGGVKCLADLRALKDAGARVVVIGRALYERAFMISDALREVGA
jgi:phosphoribosylformimino-5-aminoimidazole carboxamide ribotide isomerase